MGWRAVTESGRVYEQVRRGVKVQGESYFHNARVSVVDREHLPELEGAEETWAYLLNLPHAEFPEVGKSLFIFTHGDAGWRLSTAIESVEVMSGDVIN